MNRVTTTSAARIDTGIYQDPVDGAVRFYGVPGEEFGPLNLKYQTGSTEESLVTKIVGLGGERKVRDDFFGMAVQVEEPTTITQLGQFDPGKNRGVYTLSLVRAEDGKVLATADLDMGHTHPDAMGFKYTRLGGTRPLGLCRKADHYLSARIVGSRDLRRDGKQIRVPCAGDRGKADV